MKKIAAVLTAMFLIITVLQAKEPKDCKKFRNGTFRMTHQGVKSIIKRNGNKQEQYLDGSKKPYVLNVKWIDDCTCTLTPMKSDIKMLKGVPANAVMTQKIVKTGGNSYTQLTSANFTKQTITNEIYKIK